MNRARSTKEMWAISCSHNFRPCLLLCVCFCPTVRVVPTACVFLYGAPEYSEDTDAKRSFTTCLKCGKQLSNALKNVKMKPRKHGIFLTWFYLYVLTASCAFAVISLYVDMCICRRWKPLCTWHLELVTVKLLSSCCKMQLQWTPKPRYTFHFILFCCILVWHLITFCFSLVCTCWSFIINLWTETSVHR